jgi:RNA recognition motif-containing protein
MEQIVYTRGFPATFTKENLSEFFNAFGKVRKIKLISEEKKLYAIIFFFSHEDAKKTIENLHDKTIDGIKWYANFRESQHVHDWKKRNRLSRDRANTVFLKDFPESFTETVAREIFSKHGVIKSLFIKPPYSFITYENYDQSLEAVKKEKYLVLEGRRVYVAIQQDRYKLHELIEKKKLYKTRLGRNQYNRNPYDHY